MIKGNTKKPLTYDPRRSLKHYHSKDSNSYRRTRKTSSGHKKFSYYHLITIFCVGLLGGYLINNGNQNQSVKLENTNLTSKTETVKVANASHKVSKQKAFNLVWNLEQVQHKAKEIKNLSKGTITVDATVQSSPAVNSPFYMVQVFEKHPHQTTSPIYWFRVSSSSGEIEALDWVESEFIPLEEWNPDGRL